MDRRGFLGAIAAAGLYAAGCGRTGSRESPSAAQGHINPGGPDVFGPLKQIEAGDLNIGYAEAGPSDGPPVLLLHGWPYDIHSFVDVAPLLATAGYRVIVPYLRGYGTTRFLSGDTFRDRKSTRLNSSHGYIS